MFELAELKAALHEAVDRCLDEFLADTANPETSARDRQEIVVVPGSSAGEWTYPSPKGDEQQFFATRWYEADGTRGRQRVLVAWIRKFSWNSDRKRAIVFNQVGGINSTTFYPWAEFVETDDGRYAAPIPDVDRPRAIATDPALLPQHLKKSVVARADVLFGSVNDGPSLRLVVDEGEEVAMVQHGYWVATLRRRI
jgi:hypothetical protein